MREIITGTIKGKDSIKKDMPHREGIVSKRAKLSLATFFLSSMLWTGCNYSEEKKPPGGRPSERPGQGSDQKKAPESPSVPNPEPENKEPVVTFQLLQSELFEPYCVSCHNSGVKLGGISLSSEEDVKTGVGKRSKRRAYVAGQPLESGVYITLQNGSMPPSGSRPSKEVLDKLCEWIKGRSEPEENRSRGGESTSPTAEVADSSPVVNAAPPEETCP